MTTTAPDRSSTRAMLAAVVTAALLLGACADDAEPDIDTGADAERPSPETDEATVTTSAPRHPACEDPVQGLYVRAPEGWEATPPDFGEPCRLFDPDPESIRTGERPSDEAAISLQVDVGPFEEAVPSDGPTDEAEIDGRDAVRLEDDERVEWTVDMRDGRYLRARSATSDSSVVEVLDEMVHSIRWIDPRTAGEGIDPIADPGDPPVASSDFPRLDEPVLVLSDLRSAGQDGFDRVVVELDNGGDAEPPSYEVRQVDGPFVDRENGAAVPVEGEVFVEIRISPATNTLPNRERAYEGPDRIPSPDSEVIAEVVRLRAAGDTERVVVGLTRSVPIAVATLDDPARVVVDLVHDDDLVPDS